MNNEEQKSENPSFLKRYWWGIFCSILFILGGSYQCSTRTMPSAMFGGPIYFGKAQKGTVLLVQKTTDNFRIIVAGGDDFNYSKGIDVKGSRSPYPFTKGNDGVQIIGLTPRLSQGEMNALWAGDPVRVSENENGIIKVSIGYDAPGQVLSGIYYVNGDTISGHHFKHGSLLKGLVFMCGVLVLYASGATIKGIVRFIRWRKYRQQINSKQV